MFNTVIVRTFATLALTLLTSATLVLSAVGPAEAGGAHATLAHAAQFMA